MQIPIIHVTPLREIGGGSQARVYLANDKQGNRVAFKRPHNASMLAAMLKEADNAFRLRHPNVVKVLGIGEQIGTGDRGIVTELIDGPDLRTYLVERASPTEPGELWRLAFGIAEGIDYSHECDVVHLDLKPENILIGRSDWMAKLVDFGLARQLIGSHAPSAQAAGTPYYMAPEVWRLNEASKPNDPDRLRLRRADIYSFAVILYECLTRRLPFEYPTVQPGGAGLDVLAMIRDVTLRGVCVPSERIPAPAWQVLRSALDIDASKRPARAASLVRRLQAAWTSSSFFDPAVPTSELGPGGMPNRVVHHVDGADMVLIPAHDFVFGSDTEGRPDNRPAQTIRVEAFYIDLCLVTNRQFARFVHAAKPTLLGEWQRYYTPGENELHPVRGIVYEDAEAYCSWAGKNLPIEIEWECVAKGPDGRLYPWGNQFREDLAHFIPNASSDSSPISVGGFAANDFGLFDLAGNVAELMRGWYKADFYERLHALASTPTRELFDPKGGLRILRGGSWASPPEELMTIVRSSCDPDASDPHVGFRTVWYPPR